MSAYELYQELDTYTSALLHQVDTGDAEVRLLRHAPEGGYREMASRVRNVTMLAQQGGKANMSFLKMQKQMQGMGSAGMNTGHLDTIKARIRERNLDICRFCYPDQNIDPV
ncbi:hypothetical protein [Haloglycomyces albus]|uniref:hypothetical protein n=1 Tax=Haloglycomyces albus TaxID=526067 RepID=UPI00046CC1C2|nr:hypothetical protein [Haloglycomyces albus]